VLRPLVAFAVLTAGWSFAPVATAQPTRDSAAIAALAQQSGAALPFDANVRVGRLSNGMRYFIRENSRPEKRVELRLVVNVGSVLEDDAQRGLAHVLEHMAFNGTRRFAKTEIVDFIERSGMTFGADLNAGTSFDETVYQLQLPSDTGRFISRAFEWFADVAGGGILLEAAEVEKERPVVIEEWRLGKGAIERIQQQQLPLLFKDSRYADRLPIGTKEVLDTFTRDDLLRFYRDWYRPDLMGLVVVGDIKADSIEAMIRANFGSIAPAVATARSRDAYTVPGHTETLVSVATDKEYPQSNVAVVWKKTAVAGGTVADYERDIALGLALSMFNQRLDEIVRRPGAPFSGAGASQGRLVRPLETFQLSAVVSDGGIANGLTAVLTEAERVRRFGFTQTELDRAKTSLLRSLELQYAERTRTNSATFAARYTDHILTGDPVLGIEQRLPLVNALVPQITLAEVNALTQGWLADANRVILAAAPEKEGAPVPSSAELLRILNQAQSATVTAYVDSEAGATLVASPPTPGSITASRTLPALGVTEWTLSNGAKVLYKQTDFQADQVVFSGTSIGGVGADAGNIKDFYSVILGPQLLERGGAGTLDAIELRKLLTGKVAAVSAAFDERSESVSGSASVKDIGTLFELVWAKLITPRVDTAAIDAFKQQLAPVFANRANQPAAVYQDTVSVTMGSGHPLTQPLTTEAIRQLDPGLALRVFKDRFADFSDFTFIVVGNVDEATLRPLVERWLAPLPGRGRRETPVDLGVRPPTGVIKKVVRKGVEPQAQTTILLTGETEWTRARGLHSQVLTEVLQIRLRETLREDLGGTYGAGASVSLERWPTGRFQTAVQFGSSPARADTLADVALEVVRKLAAEGPTADELSKVKENLLRSRETALKQNGFWQSVLQQSVLWGDDPTELITGYTARVEAMTLADITTTAKLVLDPTNRATFVLLPEKDTP
jgi:zinc protease